MLFLFFLIQMVLLYLLSRWLNQSIYSFFYRLSRSEHVAITATTLVLFPGTVVHELSHLFVAEVLGVKTGKLNLFPERLGESHIQAGSVEIARTDPFRRTIIGIAPVLIGVISITLLSMYLSRLFPDALIAAKQPDVLKNPIIYLFSLLGYLLFAISNNMFSSKEDLKGVPAVLIFLGLVIGAAYIVGFRIQLTGQILTGLESVLGTLTTNILVVLGINTVLLLLTRGLLLFLPRQVAYRVSSSHLFRERYQ